ncbi:MAG TPA: ATP synthase F0 subunit B [Pyrinomonadaceae bacterium]|nr:ATP synthase F0 subunit B [Pyrinomonadaceae bacterium]
MLLLVSGEWMEWFNYPGLELWKFLNLALFLAAAIFILRRKINEALLARGESIKQELVVAQKEREKALAQLAEADNRLNHLDEDVRLVREQARREAEAERQRQAASTEREVEKLKQQAQRDIETADKVARKELRQYLAQRSVEFARESVKSQMRPEDDALLIKDSIGELRRTTV